MDKKELDHYNALFEECWDKYLVRLKGKMPPAELSTLIEAGFIRSNKMAYKSGFLSAVEIMLTKGQ